MDFWDLHRNAFRKSWHGWAVIADRHHCFAFRLQADRFPADRQFPDGLVRNLSDFGVHGI